MLQRHKRVRLVVLIACKTCAFFFLCKRQHFTPPSHCDYSLLGYRVGDAGAQKGAAARRQKVKGRGGAAHRRH
jgi:hypothetical protein